QKHAGAVSSTDAQIPGAVERGRAAMGELKERGLHVLRRVAKGAAALALHYSGARELLSAVQRRAVGGRRVLILSYHRVVADFGLEEKRSLYTLNIEQRTFRRHLEVLQESHDVVSLEDALSVLDGTRQAARDVAVITFDDGYRDVYSHAFPVMRDLRVPGIVYVPSSFVGTDRRLGLGSHRPPDGELPVTWEMLKEMEAHGLVTGAHSAEHTVLTNQRLDDARREIAQCKAALEKGLKKPIRHFAYCNGYYSAGVAQ